MIGLVRICLRPKIFGSSRLRRSLLGRTKSCVFGKDIGINFKSCNGPDEVRTRQEFYEAQSSQPATSEAQIEHMALKKSEKVRKLVPLKVPYEELRPFRHEDHAQLTAGTHDLWDGLAGGILQTHFEGTTRTLGKDLLRSCLCECVWSMDGSMTTHLTPHLVNFYRGMKLLTREEEERFPREQESFTVESSEGTKDKNRSPAVPTHTTARGPLQVDVVPRQEQPEKRVAKKRKVVSDDEEELFHMVRRMDMDVSGARQHRARARSKKRAKRRMMTVEVSDSSVEKTVAPIVNTSEVATSKVMRSVELGVPSEVSIEDPADIPVEPLNEGTDLVSPISLSSERTRSAQGEETPQMKMNENLEKEFTSSKEILEQVVARIGGTVVEAEGITLPTSLVEEVRPEEEQKTSLGEEVKTLEVTFPEFLQDSLVPLLKYLDGKRRKYAVSKEPGFYVQMIRNRTKLKRAVAV
ncbi:hypothetical protein AXG93_2611s1000 [Marchantia polymorpha subsp. ruderalis]|uniref:Uncharacterized protein n=1 Tax=Marchantia polymorpha subsp. ruderalis TaxID=1480154 RepID=A0A176VGR7_MARPO|nr:hypothetical protein AXG93_2611s1000 [Marchantia polymorpha subsp. ruderalis]